MDIFDAVYFSHFSSSSFAFYIFVLSSKTEAGSAGEQPARDNLRTIKKSTVRELFLEEGSLDFLGVPMPSKTHQ